MIIEPNIKYRIVIFELIRYHLTKVGGSGHSAFSTLEFKINISKEVGEDQNLSRLKY